MDVTSAVFLFNAAAAWVAAGYKIRSLVAEPRNAALWALALSIVLPATGFTLAAPVVYPYPGGWSGVPNLATLLVYACISGYGLVSSVMLLLWQRPVTAARVLVLGGLYAVALTVMTVLFLRLPPGPERPLDFDEVYGVTRTGGSFLILYVGVFGTGLLAGAVRGRQLSRRVARDGGHPWLRRGLRLVAAGSLVGLGYCAGKAAFVLLAWAGVVVPLLSRVAVLCACVAALLMATGLTMPSWGPRLAAVTRWWEQLTAYHRLGSLWNVIYRSVPGVALQQPGSRLSVRDIDYRLYRRLTEIRDGLMLLAPAGGDPVAVARQLRRATSPPETAPTAPAHRPDLAWLLAVSAALKEDR